MTTPTAEIRQIFETLRLDACASGDVVTIPYSPTGSWKTLGRVILDKIKPLAKPGRVQIKYRVEGQAGATVQKVDLDGGTQVQRVRTATESDGPGAGIPLPSRVEHDGVSYVAAVGRDAQTLLDEALDVHKFPIVGSLSLATVLAGLTFATLSEHASIKEDPQA